jgi:hypothetical protein
LLTLRTMAAWKHPLTGGIVCMAFSIALRTAVSSATSHGGHRTWTPEPRKASSILLDCFFSPLRDRRSKFLAPRSTSHCAMLRPMPPRPPAMTYVASSRKRKSECGPCTTFIHVRPNIRTQDRRHLQIHGLLRQFQSQSCQCSLHSTYIEGLAPVLQWDKLSVDVQI